MLSWQRFALDWRPAAAGGTITLVAPDACGVATQPGPHGDDRVTVRRDRPAQCEAVFSAEASSGWARSFQFHQPPPIAVRNCTVSR
jgi:hypothetical protein